MHWSFPAISLTREPEQIRAYRDTWQLGIQSYLTYLRDRLLLAKDLLADSGSIFVQIGDQNLHLVKSLLDEVFGRGNSAALITFAKTGVQSDDELVGVADDTRTTSRCYPLTSMKHPDRP